MKLISYYDLLEMIKEGNIPDKVYWINNRKEKISYIADYDIEFNCYFLENINEENEDIAFYLGDNFLESTIFKECIEIPNDNFENIEKITIRDKTIGFPKGEWTARNMDIAFSIKINQLIKNQRKLIEMLKEKK